MKRLIAILLALFMFAGILSVSAETVAKVTIVFTHDMHSHLEPDATGTGGFAKLKTQVNAARSQYGDILLVDAGDFSMGTLYQTIFASEAPELRMMGEIGYDAFTLGNHEFDYGSDNLASMLTATKNSVDPAPALVLSNILWPEDDTAQALKTAALDVYGATECAYFTKNGVKIAVIGLMGRDAEAAAPTSGLSFSPMIDAARKQAAEARAQGAELIVALSHGGTSDDPKSSEDELLAQSVQELDVIISGHTHTTLNEYKQVGRTLIVSCGSFLENVGQLTLIRSGERWAAEEYSLIPLQAEVPEDTQTQERVQSFGGIIDGEYLSRFGYTRNQVLANNTVSFPSVSDLYSRHQESTLGNLVADAYGWAAENAEGGNVDVAVAPVGAIRGSLPSGDITVSDVFNVASLGIGADGVPGAPLLAVYLTGTELKTVAEVDASISTIMDAAQLNLRGLGFRFNPNRLLLNRVTDVWLIDSGGARREIDENHLYRVIAGLYTAQMLSSANSKSFGLLSLVPKNADGTPVTDFASCILHNPNGTELKEWQALAQYLSSASGSILQKYAQTDGRKVVDDDTSLYALIVSPNKIAYMAIGAILVLLVLITLILWLPLHFIRRRKKRKQHKK